MVPSDRKRLDLALRGYRLATAEITYRRPDLRSLLQTFVWQDLDHARLSGVEAVSGVLGETPRHTSTDRCIRSA